ncbi:MAG: 2-octaprenyl-6-methoxyphenyl hydroxylase [Porticoccaceae bacterium]|nr:2-octaprenyl-6-methoxyphenyl hydroxylase [Porticoccaceae bacterium]
MTVDETDRGREYDIVIVGGGMVGISLALLLNRQALQGSEQRPRRILLVEAQEISLSKGTGYSASFDARSTALSWSSRKIYQLIGVWPELKTQVSEIAQIHVSDRSHMGLTRIDAQEAGVEALGYVVENRWLGSVLHKQLAATDIEVRDAVSIESIRPLAAGMRLSVGGQVIDTRLLVIADGADSSTAKKLGIQTQRHDYNQTGIIANLCLQKSHAGVAYERFTDQGPMALLPLSNFAGRPRSALVWTQPNDVAQTLMSADDQSFLEQLQQRFGHRLGRFQQVGERISYPLALTTSAEQVRRNLVVMGNAAHSLHPVAGQGFNLSLRDAAALADSLAQVANDQLGDLETLERYQQRQAADQRNTVIFSDSLPKLFGISSSAAALGRNAGLVAMDLVPALRNGFARFGMGMATSEAGNQ